MSVSQSDSGTQIPGQVPVTLPYQTVAATMQDRRHSLSLKI